jgi:hypothetical protein
VVFTREEVAAILAQAARREHTIIGSVITQTVQGPSERDDEQNYELVFVTE